MDWCLQNQNLSQAKRGIGQARASVYCHQCLIWGARQPAEASIVPFLGAVVLSWTTKPLHKTVDGLQHAITAQRLINWSSPHWSLNGEPHQQWQSAFVLVPTSQSRNSWLYEGYAAIRTEETSQIAEIAISSIKCLWLFQFVWYLHLNWH